MKKTCVLISSLPQGAEERIETPIPVTQLSADWKADRKSLVKYHNKIITVSGRVASKTPRQVVLESQETAQPLKVVCLFSTGAAPEFADVPDIRIQGLCRIAAGAFTVRLDNCRADPSQVREAALLLTADFLPHAQGTTLIYDFAFFPPLVKGSPVVSRHVWFYRDGSLTDTVVTHNGRMTAKSLFESNSSDDWINGPRVKKGRIQGPVLVQKTFDGMIGQGPRVVGPASNAQDALEPAVKLGAKVGDSWTFVRNKAKHTCTLARFDTWRGRVSAVVTELVVTPLPGDLQREVRHVYARGIGEVERQEWLHVTSTEKNLIAEKKLILLEDLSFRGFEPKKKGEKSPVQGETKKDRINPKK